MKKYIKYYIIWAGYISIPIVGLVVFAVTRDAEVLGFTFVMMFLSLIPYILLLGTFIGGE